MFEGENSTICSIEQDESSVTSNESGVESKASYISSNSSLTDASHVVGNDSDSKERSYSSIDGTHLSTDTMAVIDSSFASSANSNITSFFDETSSPVITPQTSIDKNLAFYEIEQIFDVINKDIEDIAETTQLPPSISRILLNHFNWDKETLESKYFESKDRGDDKDFFRKCRVVDPTSLLDVPQDNCADDCRICFKTSEKTIDGVLTSALCGHKFCSICWDQYFSTKITNEGLSETISCAEYKCNVIVEDTFVMSMLTDPAIKLLYKRLLVNNFIKLKQDWCWCPSPKCNLAIEVLKIDAVAICECGVRFCHKCFDDWHAPVECRHLKIWKSDDSATQIYLANKTKDCPKCGAPIEKNGGCNHMTCSRCSHQFCWLCLGNWSSHDSNYECNRYKANENIEIAKKEKLNHFWSRYCEHRKSLQFEQELSDKFTKSNEANEAKNTEKSPKEIKCFQKGFTELLECRRMLMNT